MEMSLKEEIAGVIDGLNILIAINHKTVETEVVRNMLVNILQKPKAPLSAVTEQES